MSTEERATELADLLGRRLGERIGSSAPGGAWGVFSAHGGLVHSAAAGRSGDGGTRPDERTAFRIASCTKSFTAAAALLLRDRGVLDLDLPIDSYLPYPVPIRFADAIARVTTRMLLTMSAGFPTDDPWADRQESLAVHEFSEVVGAGLRCAWQPGTRFEYSNLGYALAGQVIEAVSGDEYTTFVRRELLRPLELLGTDFAPPAGHRMAVGYRQTPDGWAPQPISSPGVFSAIGGLFSTVTDLSAWAGWLARGFDRGDDAGPLAASSRRELQQLSRIAPSRATTAPGAHEGYGMGLFVEHGDAGRTIFHSGGYPGYTTHMRWHLESGVGAVAFENASYTGLTTPLASAMLELPPVRWDPQPWPETLAAASRINQMLHEGTLVDDPAVFSANVALDRPFDERQAELEALLSGGACDGSMTAMHADSPAALTWRTRSGGAALSCAILMTPAAATRVQSLRINRVQ
jgi:CubicO group peptidase (beta-lactamase class C family)